MFRALIIGVIAFILAAVTGGRVVAALARLKLGKALRDDEPELHAPKAGTPTMGGILIFATVLVVTLLFNLASRLSILLPFCVIAATGALGIFDDLGGLLGGRHRALSWRLKLALLSVLSLGAGVVLYHYLGDDHVAIPWYGRVSLGVLVIPLAVPIITGTTTAVAITDGLDGLAGGTAALAFAAYGIIGAMQGQDFLSAFCFTVVGAVLGFLWYNAHPARVIMGEVGALPLGAALGVVAMMTEQWIVLPLIGVVFLANAVSDVIQIVYFKFTHGRRVFRMAPLHNHFELLGWPETRVVLRFWLVGAAGAMLGVAAALKA